MAGMSSHELARLLLSLEDLPVATHAYDYTFNSGDGRTPSINVGRLEHYAGAHIIIGNFRRRSINAPNWYVSEVFLGDVPEKDS